MSLALWQQCLDYLRDELSAQQFNTWIRPLQAEEGEANELRLLAPNRFVRDWVGDKYAKRINELLRELSPAKPPRVALAVGSRKTAAVNWVHRYQLGRVLPWQRPRAGTLPIPSMQLNGRRRRVLPYALRRMSGKCRWRVA